VATIFISLVSQLGDLFISFLKRLAKLKDTGNILPGHGGILDRVDGILFAAPVGLLLLDYLSIN
jgi:phosphatidate cytidylyltransferase